MVRQAVATTLALGLLALTACSSKPSSTTDAGSQSSAASCQTDQDCPLGRCYSGKCCAEDCVGGGAGSTCTTNDECSSGLCGPTGHGTHCCTANTTCSATNAACGATDCDNTGACAYQPSGTRAAGLTQTAGDCQDVVCDGNGGTTSVNDLNDIPGPSGTVCATKPACCVNSSNVAKACYTDAAVGTDCVSDGHAPNSVCGDPNNAAIAGMCVECNTLSDCYSENDAGEWVCNTMTGQCMECVPPGGMVSNAGECSSFCCTRSCSSGTTCQ